jgi:hypothetical protein
MVLPILGRGLKTQFFSKNSTFWIIEELCIAMRQMKLEGKSFDKY